MTSASEHARERLFVLNDYEASDRVLSGSPVQRPDVLFQSIGARSA